MEESSEIILLPFKVLIMELMRVMKEQETGSSFHVEKQSGILSTDLQSLAINCNWSCPH